MKRECTTVKRVICLYVTYKSGRQTRHCHGYTRETAEKSQAGFLSLPTVWRCVIRTEFEIIKEAC